MNRLVPLAAVLVIGFGLVLWFARPQSSFEWAAWIQAIGVLMALFWGAQLQREAANRTTRQAQHVAALFAANMHWVFRELADACGKANWADFVVHRRILEEILAQGREASLQQLLLALLAQEAQAGPYLDTTFRRPDVSRQLGQLLLALLA